MSSPPPFENKPQCNKCGVKFNIINRQHHCRNCGRSYCNACSKSNIPLPHYRLMEPQRVCDECLAHVQDHYRTKAATAGGSTPPVSNSSLAQDRSMASSPPTAFSSPSAPAAAASVPSFMSSSSAHTPQQSSSFISAGPSNAGVAPLSASAAVSPAGHTSAAASYGASVAPAAPAAANAVRRPAAPYSSGAQAFGQFSGFGRSAAPKYDLSADQAKLNDQCRDAIKNNDSAGVTQLLAAGADAKYVDHTGNSLLHLAAMFDRFDIAKSLLGAGASLTVKNPAGETPLDIAPPAMQHKLQAMAAA